MRKYLIGITICCFGFFANAETGATDGLVKSEEVDSSEVKKEYSNGKISASKLNVRARNSAHGEVVCQLLKGSVVEIVTEAGDWWGIVAPLKSSIWIRSRDLKSNNVVKSLTKAYAGPGILYTEIYIFKDASEIITVRTLGKWVQIQPNSDVVVWVHKDYVTLDKVAAVVDNKTPVIDQKPAEEENIDIEIEKKKKVVVLDVKTDLLPEEVLNRSVEVAKPMSNNTKNTRTIGFVTKLSEGYSEKATHGLAVKIRGKIVPICYLKSASHNLDNWLGKVVMITGQKNWYTGWQRPVVEVGTITDDLSKIDKIIMSNKEEKEKKQEKSVEKNEDSK